MACHILFLVAVLFITSVSSQTEDFVSIDCGTSQGSLDANLIPWSGDDGYLVPNGESYVVQTESISPVLDTLRAFTKRNKNCYSMKLLTDGKGRRVLVRASFYYGNYDGKSAPPTFDLQFDGNHWITVETTSTGYIYFEVIYVLKGDFLSVCVARTRPGQFPFISALEVRFLPDSMYKSFDKNYPLHVIRRVAYGADGDIRYGDDPYDRIWRAAGGDGLMSVKNDGLPSGLTVEDEPPSLALQSAVTTTIPTARGIKLFVGISSVEEIPVSINMYFSEVSQLDSDQSRAFQIVVNDKPLFDSPVIPPYMNCTEYGIDYNASSTNSLELVRTEDSTLPPLINAIEVFLIGDATTDGTNTNDVDGLGLLKDAFVEIKDWFGDPCLPSPYSWDWINCSADPIPRVTALNLGSFNLSGQIPDFSSMDALQIIDFQNNNLVGPIPEFLATLPNLKQLNLAKNQLSGSVPESLSKKKGLKLVTTENPELCKSGESCTVANSNPGVESGSGFGSGSGSGSGGRKKKGSKVGLIVGTSLPTFIVVWAIIGALALFRHRRKAAAVAAAVINSGTNASPLNPQDLGKMGMEFMNDVKVNMEADQSNVEMGDQTNDQHQNGTT